MYLVVVCVPVTSYSTVGKLESQGNRGVHDHHYTHSPGRHLDDLYRRRGGGYNSRNPFWAVLVYIEGLYGSLNRFSLLCTNRPAQEIPVAGGVTMYC